MGKDTINNWIIPFLSVGKRGFKSNFDLASIFLLILKRLKIGVQWRELPIESYFEKGEISWQNVYYYFNKWSKDGSFQRVWLNLLSKKKRKLVFNWMAVIHVVAKKENLQVIKQEKKL